MRHARIAAVVVAALGFGIFSLGAIPSAEAQERSLEEGPVVRRVLLYRSARLELAPSLGHTLNDTYRRSMVLNLGINYHLTNAFSLGTNIGWAALKYNTNILDNLEEANPRVSEQLQFAENTLLTTFHLGFVPWFGKFNFLDVGTVNYDFHIIAGVAGALRSSDSDDLSGFKFGPAFGAGFRFFVNGDMAIGFDITDYMYSAPDVQRLTQLGEDEFSHHIMVTLGVSLFVTGELRVSR